MFEKEIKFISDFSLNKVKNLGSYITFEKLSSINLHPAILTYLSAELEYMIFADRNQLLKDSLFDYSGKEISQNFKKIADEIKKTKKMSFEDIKKLIIQAVSFNVNYIVRPKWSLTKLVYNNKETVSVKDLELILSYVYYYDYIKNVLTAYITKRQLVQFSVTEFDLILNKIDRELFKSNSEKLVNNSLAAMGDFFNIGGIDRTKVPMNGVEILLKEKNLIDYLLKLNRVIPEESKKKYDIDDIKNILYSADLVTGIETKSEEGVQEEHTMEISGMDDIAIETEAEVDTEEVLPIEEEFKNDLESQTVEKSEPEIQQETNADAEELILDSKTEPVTESELNELHEDEVTAEKDISISDEIVTEAKHDIEPEKTVLADESSTTDDDELLAYYEKELSIIDDKLSDTITSEEESIQADDDTGIRITEDTVVVPINSEEKDDKESIGAENFNLSIFDEGEKKEVEETASEEKLKEADGMVRTADEITEIKEEKTEPITD